MYLFLLPLTEQITFGVYCYQKFKFKNSTQYAYIYIGFYVNANILFFRLLRNYRDFFFYENIDITPHTISTYTRT